MPKISKPVEKSAPRKPVQTRGIQTREKILNAGEKLFISDGFHQVLADDIAREAGVSVGSFYSYFKDKRDVFLALVERSSAEMMAQAVERLSALSDEGESNVAELIQKTMAILMEAHRRFSPLFQQAEQMAVYDEEIRALQVEIDRSTRQVFENLLLRLSPNLERNRVPAITFVLYYAAEGVLHNLVNLSDAEINSQEVTAELSRLITGYAGTIADSR